MSYKKRITALQQACFNDVFSFLGPHLLTEGDAAGNYEIRCYLPGAENVAVIMASADIINCQRCGDSDLFVGQVAAEDYDSDYQLSVDYPLGTVLLHDPYRFASGLDEAAIYLFNEGNQQQAYRHLGAHFVQQEGIDGVRFSVWAPNAQCVSVIGDFNYWNPCCHIMRKHPASGLWDLFVPGLEPGECYKFSIVGVHGERLDKADPYAAAMQHPPQTASVLVRPRASVVDKKWVEQRQLSNRVDQPVSIYEVHAGSWKRVTDEACRYLSYREMAEQLVPYVSDMGFTHVQFMPLTEFPFDGSWGYQPVGLFCPTSRFGDAADFADMVQAFHAAGIGVLLDWVPGHFPSDPYGLLSFDGSHLYEHADMRLGFHPDWNTYIYNYGRDEVRSFLISSANYWMDQFGLDGLRVDAVASMLYLDYSREEGQWLPNRHGGRENLEAISLLQTVNSRSYESHPGVMMVAEESTAWPGVTNFVDQGGLGFGYKWNMGWMNDSLSYMEKDPLYRQHHHHQLTFSMVYAFSENYILPISHDEVVHGKGSMLDKMPGDEWQKFANLRAYYGFMWSHPGKKLLFMGCEFGQRQEWNHDQSLDWHLLDDARHQGLQQLVKDLNYLYRAEPALHQLDCDSQGFRWIDSGDAAQSIFSFIRYSRDQQQAMVVVVNMTPAVYTDFRVGVEFPGDYYQMFNSDDEKYGGSNSGVVEKVSSEKQANHGLTNSIVIDIAPLATMMFRWEVS